MSVLASNYVKDYTKIILSRIQDAQTILNRKFVSVAFKGLYQYNKTTHQWTLREKIQLPALAGGFFMDNGEMFPGLGLLLDSNTRGIRRQPIFMIDLWARNPIERDLISGILDKIMFQQTYHFASQGIRDIELIGARSRQYDPGDRILENVSHVTVPVQRLLLLYRLTVEHTWSPVAEGYGTIGTIIITDTGVGETVTWQLGGGYLDPLILNSFDLWRDIKI